MAIHQASTERVWHEGGQRQRLRNGDTRALLQMMRADNLLFLVQFAVERVPRSGEGGERGGSISPSLFVRVTLRPRRINGGIIVEIDRIIIDRGRAGFKRIFECQDPRM